MAIRLMGALSVAALITATLAAPAVAAVINGTNDTDVLVGSAKADIMHGYAGHDTLSGRAGADKLYGGRGGDMMSAGRDGRRDLLYGGPGQDRIRARMFDKVYAGRGNDVIRYVGTRGYDNRLRVDCGPGYDVVYGGWQAKIVRGCEDLRPRSYALFRYQRRMPDPWEAPVVIPYGDSEDQLGTSLGGDGEGIRWGPSYGAVAPDGTWWILDGAKFRFAHYDSSGTYLGAVAIPASHLVNGQLMQWRYPLALADGTIVTYRMTETGGTLLLLRNGSFHEVALNRQVAIKTDDGLMLYGFGAQNGLLAVDVTSGKVAKVAAFRSRTGVRYRLMRENTTLRFAIPDTGVKHRWPLVAAETGAPAAGAISLASTADGRLHLFVDGAAENDEATGRSGYGTVGVKGQLHATEPTRVPWSESDDGTGSRLVARPGSNEVWFIAIDTDALRLYRRR